MRRPATLILGFLCLTATAAHGQSPQMGQVHVASGSVLNFYLQTRLNPDSSDSLRTLPKGTLLHVRMLDSIDSTVNRDGSPFRGSIVSPLVSGDQVLVHSDAEVHGLLALLRSRSHPNGFRYELLITGLVDHGKAYTLTASLESSFFDSSRKISPNQQEGTNTGGAANEPPARDPHSDLGETAPH
jgi:hypothetical protein